MKEIWNRIETLMATKASDVDIRLLPGATDEEIRQTEDFLGIEFPEDVKASFKIHNGQHGLATPLMGDWQLFSLEDLRNDWESMKDLLDSKSGDDLVSTSFGPVRGEWWNPKWIEVAYNGAGDLLCLDLDPPQDGNQGQIITFWHELEDREVLASDFRSWLATFAQDLESGKYQVDSGMLVIPEE